MISLAVRFLSMRSLTCKGVWLTSMGLLPYQLLQVFMVACYIKLVNLIGRREARHCILLHYREVFIYKLLHCYEVLPQPSSVIISVSRKVFLKSAMITHHKGNTHTDNLMTNAHITLKNLWRSLAIETSQKFSYVPTCIILLHYYQNT